MNLSVVFNTPQPNEILDFIEVRTAEGKEFTLDWNFSDWDKESDNTRCGYCRWVTFVDESARGRENELRGAAVTAAQAYDPKSGTERELDPGDIVFLSVSGDGGNTVVIVG